MNASDRVYGRFGGRDAEDPDTRNSLEGLRFSMQAALAEHRRNPAARPTVAAAKPLYINQVPEAKSVESCIHCHQIKEVLRKQEIRNGTWNRESIYSYPLPENLGITLDRSRGNLVKEVKPGSLAAQAGLAPGDVLKTLNERPVHSFADAQYALHKGPSQGQLALTWLHGQAMKAATLRLEPGWRRTNITWRPSLLDLLPSAFSGIDLTAAEKKKLGLDEKRLAFLQDAPVRPAASAMGIEENDIILGIDNKTLEMAKDQFRSYVRQNYLVNEAATLNILRNGKRLDLKVKLR